MSNNKTGGVWFWLVAGLVAGVGVGRMWLAPGNGQSESGNDESLISDCDRAVQELEERLSATG